MEFVAYKYIIVKERYTIMHVTSSCNYIQVWANVVHVIHTVVFVY